jgi:uncharacterized protein (TIGR03085 family)
VTTFARRERGALCDLALAVGPDAPTLCGSWTVRDLVVHLLVRERRPWAAPGILVPALSGLVDHASTALAQRPFEELVETLRTPPAPVRIGTIERLVNTLEFFVHHEDVRRAAPDWTPRPLDAGDGADLWRSLSMIGRGLVRPAGVPVVATDGHRTVTLRRGDRPAVVSGPVGELALFLFGRTPVLGVTFDGPAATVAALRDASLGF